MTDREEIVRRVYVHIDQLAKDPPDDEVGMIEIDHYHRLLDRLESVGLDMSDFRVNPDTDMYHPVKGYDEYFNPIGWPHKVMEPKAFARRVRALAAYFEIRAKPIIYSGPAKSSSQ